MPGGVGVRAAVGPLEAGQLRDPPVELVADERAVLHQVPGLALDALVVVPDGRQAVLGGAVTGDVHQLGAVLQLAELVEGGEGGARVGGLVAQRAVQLGGVPDGLVDGQPQVGRVDDQVVDARLDARRAHLLGEQLRDPRQLDSQSQPVPVRYSQPRPTGGARVRIESNSPLDSSTATAVSCGCSRTRCWVVTVPGGVRVELVLVHGEQRGVHVVDPVGRQQPRAPLGEQRGLLLVGHGERIDLVRRDPGPLGVHRLVGQLHPLVGPGRLDHLRGQLRHRHRLRGDLRGGVHGQVHPGGEPQVPPCTTRTAYPRSVVSDDPAGLASRSRQDGAAHPLEAEVRVLGPQRARPGERGVGEGPQRQRREGFVDGMRHGGLPVAVVACRVRSCRAAGAADHIICARDPHDASGTPLAHGFL